MWSIITQLTIMARIRWRYGRRWWNFMRMEYWWLTWCYTFWPIAIDINGLNYFTEWIITNNLWNKIVFNFQFFMSHRLWQNIAILRNIKLNRIKLNLIRRLCQNILTFSFLLNPFLQLIILLLKCLTFEGHDYHSFLIILILCFIDC